MQSKMALFSRTLLPLLLLLPIVVKSQFNGSIPLDSSIAASESQQFSSSWRSPSGDFAFGFRKIEPNKDFLLAIWFDKIPDKTVVWYAYVDSPVPEGSKVTLTGDRGLVLTDPQGNQIWSSEFSTGSVSRGFMNDTGNFVLENGGSDELWSSFANPTDTLLPAQVMDVTRALSSRQSETNFSTGRFRLRMLENGNLELNVFNLPAKNAYGAYYVSETQDQPTGSASSSHLVFNETGDMYILRRNGTMFRLNERERISSGDTYQRAVLHFDGVFAQYYYPKRQTAGSNTTWLQVWSKPDNICKALTNGLGSGACGFNNVCSLGENQRPKCRCPDEFSLVDENNEYGDCKPDFELSLCGSDNWDNRTVNDTYDFIPLRDIDWPLSDYEQYDYYDEERCRVSCLQDCFCVVAVFRDNTCWKKKYPMSNGRVDQSLNARAFIKVPKGRNSWGGDSYSPGNPKQKEEKHSGLIIVGFTLLGTSMFFNFILIAFFHGSFVSLCHKKTNPRSAGGCLAIESNLRVFTYKKLVEATGEFKEELGRGSFGIVYKGELKAGVADDNIVIAVKKLDRIVQEGEKEFKNEVNVIGQTHHKNLVKLIGFCNEGQNRLLVYEFIPHGTLANFLFGCPKPSWKERKRIAMGIARGILYLHEECSAQIIHCDIKPQNILLDEFYNARISDFGLAKLLKINQTHTQTGIRGTKGYVATEWFRNSPITAKVDVFSYGVLLLEIVCCKKAVDLEDNMILTDWAYDCFRQRRLVDLITGDSEAIEDMGTVEKYVRIAIWCIQEEPGLRPCKRKVTQTLEGVIEVSVPPNPSPYSVFTTTNTVAT